MSKKLTKALVLALCAVLLVAGSVMGTVAYLTAETSVSNTFTYGNVAITMNDAKTDAYGVVTSGRTATGSENAYKLIPGRTYVKDTTIYVDAASEDCYLFIKIEYTDPNSKITVDVADNWTSLGNGSGVYYYNTVATKSTTAVAVEGFAVNTDAVATDLQAITNPMKVTAYAVQSDSFTSASAAWNATFGATPPQS